MNILLVLGLLMQVAIPDRVEVEPSEVNLEVGQIQTFTASAYDSSGVLDLPVRWYIAEEEFARVTLSGEVTGLSPGQARLVAMMGGRPGYATITVTPREADQLQATLAAEQVLAGTFAPIEVRMWSTDGEVEVVDQARFRISDRRIATVDQSGIVSGHEPGEAVITVRLGGLREEVAVSVVPNPVVSYQIEQNRMIVRQGDVVRFRVRALDHAGQPVDGILPFWEVVGTGATITREQEYGVFVAEEPNQFVVQALIGPDLTRSITLNVDRRTYNARLEMTGRGAIDHHHSGDMWVFEGVDWTGLCVCRHLHV